MEENEQKSKNKAAFESLSVLIRRWRDGTFGEILEDWKWIFSYSARYKGAIAFYLLLGVVSTTLGLAGSVAAKYLIDIITGYQTDKLVLLICIFVGGSLFKLIFDSIINRISTRLSIHINNDIQADIFDKIVDADWLSLTQYSSGDILNRFNSDIGTVSSNAISWLPAILIAVYRFIATFVVILYYDAVMGIIAFASAPFMLLVSRAVIKKQREYGQKAREMSSKLMTFEVETFYNFDTIKSFGIAPYYSKKLRWWQERFKEISLRYNLFSIKTNIFMSVMGMLVEFAAFGYCLFRLWTHSITYGTMTLFLQQRNALLKMEDEPDPTLLSLWEEEMARHGEYIYRSRRDFIEQFIPVFQSTYETISQQHETVSLSYVSHGDRGPLLDTIRDGRSRDRAVGYSLHGVHRDDLDMTVDGYPLRREASLGQKRTMVLSMKLAQFDFLRQSGSKTTPILLLDDIFDRLDARRVEQIIALVSSERFGQTFITDTNRDHLDRILSATLRDHRLFTVEGGEVH